MASVHTPRPRTCAPAGGIAATADGGAVKFRVLSLCLLSTLVATRVSAQSSVPIALDPQQEWVGTFSIIAFDPETKQLGVGVQSRAFAAGAIVPWAKAGVGAIATQAAANRTYGPKAIA